MLLNEDHEHFHLGYDARPCEDQDTLLLITGGDVLLRVQGEHRLLPTYGELAEIASEQPLLHAFTQGERRVFFSLTDVLAEPPAGYAYEPFRVFRMMDSQEDAFILTLVSHLAVWYRKNRYCGSCGGDMRPAEAERALVCERCGSTVYPGISPAIIVAIVDGDRLLLARNANGVFRHYSLIAGFVEAGETLEQTVRREIAEEVGLRVRDIRYLGSQPWGISQSLMLGFCATLDGPAAITLQTSELADAQWFRGDELPEHAGSSSIAFEIIERFRSGKLNELLYGDQ